MGRDDIGVHVGADVGGTFTDIVVWEPERAHLWVDKVASTPADPSDGTVTGISSALAGAGLRPLDVATVRHGTTVGTNTLIQRDGATTGLITTRGFRDVLEIERTKRAVTYDFFWDRPKALVRRRYRREVTERIASDGRVETPLSEDEVGQQLQFLVKEGIESLAVSFLNSYANPEHEQRVADLIKAQAPDLHVTTGSGILPDLHEYERTNLAVINAYVAPRIAAYLGNLQAKLQANGIASEVSVTQSNGGAADIQFAQTAPIRLLLSGPSAGVTGATHIARGLGLDALVTFDMGGTSCDVCLVENGKAHVTTRGSVAQSSLELLPMLFINTIGAGGGSIGWVDQGGALKVGPASAGAIPGPASYGLGGRSATVTDAWVLSGFLSDATAIRRAVRVLPKLALDVMTELGRRAGMSPTRTAEGALRVVESNMVHAVKSVSVKRGRDPKDLTLVGYGGAGPLAAANIARELGMRRVLIPRHPGLVCALGTLVADLQYESKQSFRLPLTPESVENLRTARDGMARDLFRHFPSRDRAGVRVECEAELRYRGQYHTLTLAIPEAVDESGLAELRESFDKLFRLEYGHSRPDQPVEFDSLRVVASLPGKTEAAFAPPRPKSGVKSSRRQVTWNSRAIDVDVWDWSELGVGSRLTGPIIVEEFDTTVWIPPEADLEVMADGSILIEV